MVLDVVMGASAVLAGLVLVAFSAPLARLMREGDERLREEQPWTTVYEPQVGILASDHGRFWILRGWLLACAAGFAGVGLALLLRVAL
jgi:hypothetical protein